MANISKIVQKKMKKMVFFSQRKNTFFVLLLIIFYIIILISSKFYLKEIPKNGGSFSEIIISKQPRFINPVLATSSIDKDLSEIIYESLLEKNEFGKLKENIASFSLSDSKKIYSLKLRKDIFWSDGKNLDADDVIFTIEKIQDPLIRSPYLSIWKDVGLEKTSSHSLNLILKKPYSYFEENLTLQIMPKHIWENFDSTGFALAQANFEPIGSGPYKITSSKKNSSGFYEKISLEKNSYFWKNIYLENINFLFFENLEDYKNSLTFKDSSLIQNIFLSNELFPILEKEFSSKELERNNLITFFINLDKNDLLRDSDFREFLIKEIEGFKKNLMGVSFQEDFVKLSENIFNIKKENNFENLNNSESDDSSPKEILEKNGWQKNEVGIYEKKKNDQTLKASITLEYVDEKKFETLVKNLKNYLEKSGISVKILKKDSNSIINESIRGREFETILFGLDLGVRPDFYYFFHSSQRTDPGANISSVTSTSVDENLEKLREKKEGRAETLEKLEKNIYEEFSLIPLYSNKYSYFYNENLKNLNIYKVDNWSERFFDIENWYLYTEKVF